MNVSTSIIDADNRLKQRCNQLLDQSNQINLEIELALVKEAVGSALWEHLKESDRTIITNVLQEIEAWSNEPGDLIEYGAQFNLLHSSSVALIDFNEINSASTGLDVSPLVIHLTSLFTCSQKSSTSLRNYFAILHAAHNKELFTDEEQDILRTTLEDSQELLETAGIEEDLYKSHLEVVQTICDSFVARQSLSLALKV